MDYTSRHGYTGLGLLGIDFAVSRFGLFLRQMRAIDCISPRAPPVSPSGPASLWSCFSIASETQRNSTRSYLQVFREGALEYADFYILDTDGAQHIPGRLFEEKLARTFKYAQFLLKLLQVPSPIFVTLSLPGVKGRTMAYRDANPRRSMRRCLSITSDHQLGLAGSRFRKNSLY